MNLQQELLREHSKSQVNKIIEWIGDDEERFTELLRLFLKGDYRTTQRAAWPLGWLGELHPEWLIPWTSKLIEKLRKQEHPAVARNILRVWSKTELPEEVHGEIANSCFLLVCDRKQPVAIRAYAMQVLGQLCNMHPELWQELRPIIEADIHEEKPAFVSVGRKLLKRFNRHEHGRRPPL